MHDTHFLERLPRASYAETEMALGLYRDPELVRAILAAADAPDVTRVAIALGPGDEPSWLVVARDGGFVTCLGRGMSPGACPRVPHATVTRLAARHEELRARLAYWQACAENGGDARRLIRDVYEAGNRLPREAIVALHPLVPAIWIDLYGRAAELDRTTRELIYDESQRLLRRRDRLSSNDTDILRRIWQNEWAKAHVLVLLGSCSRDIIEFGERFPQTGEAIPPAFATMIYYVCRFGFQPHVLRALWFASRFGKYVVRALKDELARPLGNARSEAFAPLALAAIATRNEKLRAEITKTLAAPEGPGYLATLRNVIVHLLQVDARELDTHADNLVVRCAEIISSELDPPIDMASVAPPRRAALIGLAQKLLVSQPLNLWCEPKTLALALHNLRWIVKLEPEDLYYASTELPPPWEPAHTLQFLAGLAPETVATRTPTRAQAKPGRNDPCPCGSGQKYKRCCGA